MKLHVLLSLLIISLLIKGCSKLPDENIINGLSQQLEETDDFIILSSQNVKPTKTFIFYPGGLVDPHSYLKWQDELVASVPDLRIVTVKMPSNLAVLSSEKGQLVFEIFENTELWIAGGHSLGGAMSTDLVYKNQSKIEGLLYLAAYPNNNNLKEYSGSVFSISAEFDGLTTAGDISSHVEDLPEAYNMSSENDFPNQIQGKTLYYQIKGGNHAQFGDYGEQDEDGESTITREEQQSKLISLIKNYLNQL